MVHLIAFNATKQSGENEGGDEQTLIVPPHTQALFSWAVIFTPSQSSKYGY